jgi:hypothetical protein
VRLRRCTLCKRYGLPFFYEFGGRHGLAALAGFLGHKKGILPSTGCSTRQ